MERNDPSDELGEVSGRTEHGSHEFAQGGVLGDVLAPASAGPHVPLDSAAVSDEVLARRAALGDRAAFATIFHRHGPAMFRYAVNMLDGNNHDAEDALQNAWTKAWTHIEDFRGQAQLRTWLLTLTAHEVLNYRRRRRPVLIEDTLLESRRSDPGLEPEHHLQHQGLRQALTLALAELPWRQRAVWTLRAIEGLSYEEIAEVLATTPTVVRGQLHRARTALAVRMEMWR